MNDQILSKILVNWHYLQHFFLNISFISSVYCILEWVPVSSTFRQVRVSNKQDT